VPQKVAQACAVGQAFLDADEKGFEVGRPRMAGPTKARVLGLPVRNSRPIEQGEKGAIVLHERVMVKQSGDGRLVKESRRRYHSGGLLVRLSESLIHPLCKKRLFSVKERKRVAQE